MYCWKRNKNKNWRQNILGFPFVFIVNKPIHYSRALHCHVMSALHIIVRDTWRQYILAFGQIERPFINIANTRYSFNWGEGAPRYILFSCSFLNLMQYYKCIDGLIYLGVIIVPALVHHLDSLLILCSLH